MDLNEKFVITISREVGSGGHTVGKMLAGKLGVRFCDKQVMHELMQKFGLTKYEIERIKAKKKSWLGDFFDKVAPVARGEVYLQSSPRPVNAQVTANEIADAETEVLKQLASEGSCVITGRSGFSILADEPNKIDVFIRSSLESRIERVARKQNITLEQAEILIKEIDETRENYVRRISGRSRYDSRNYDLVLNMDKISEADAADLIIDFAKH